MILKSIKIVDGRELMVDDYIFSCSWDEFEDWIRKQIGGDFSWKIRPIDTKDNRETVVESILMVIRRNRSTFPEAGDLFVEKLIE